MGRVVARVAAWWPGNWWNKKTRPDFSGRAARFQQAKISTGTAVVPLDSEEFERRLQLLGDLVQPGH